MKRIFLSVVMAILVLSACNFEIDLSSPKKEVDQTEPNEKPVTSNEVETDENDEADDKATLIEKVDVGAGEFVEILISADIFSGMSSEDVIAYYHEEGVDDVTANDDGSYTLRIPKEQHQALLQEMKAQTDSEIKQIVESMNLEFITDITTNDTVTELIISINQDLYDEDMQGLVLADFSLYGMQYQVMNGVAVEDMDFEIVLVDDKTGEEFERTSTRDDF